MPVPPADALRAALLELEGVLFDLRAERARALREGLAAEGVRADRLDAATLDVAATLAPGDAARAAVAAAAAAGDPVATACDDVALALIAHRAERTFESLLARGGLTLRDGAREAVAALGARLRLGVVTRLRRVEAERLLAATAFAGALGDAFTVVVAADDRLPPGIGAGAGARHAAALARLARTLPGLAPGQVVALVDGPASVAAARAAGLRTAVVAAPTASAPRGVADTPAVCAPLSDARHTADDVAAPAPSPRAADVARISLQGLTPATLACALDLAPTPCSTPHP
jgi:beta-phosphoglucomutase-like phosphatase (HAD superfamily)